MSESAYNAERQQGSGDGGASAASDEQKLVATGRELFTEWMGKWSKNREMYLEDTKFVWFKGAQWPEAIAQARTRDKRPTLEINQMPQYVRQITNDQRQNRPSIRIRPVGKGATEKLADLYSGVIRGIEYESNAAAAYDTGFECMVVGGFGAWRVQTEYLNDDSFDQVIRIRRIANPMCVVIDPMYTEADASDMTGAFVYESMTKDEFKRRWPDSDPVDFDTNDDSYKAWQEDDLVVVADWFRVEIKVEKLYAVKNAQGAFEKVPTPDEGFDEETVAALKRGEEMGMVRSRSVERKSVVWRKMAGNQILETIPWAGKFIPVIPLFGDETNVEGDKLLQGFIRRGRDAQQMYNFWASSATERVALSPKAPFIGYKGQFKDAKWRTANEKNWAFLEAEPFIDGWPAGGQPAPLPSRQSIDAEAQGVLSMAQAARFDLQSSLGMYDASLGKQSNEISGRAIIAREKQGDTSTFHYIDNLSRAIRYTGKVLVDLIPKIYDTPRLMRVIGEDQQEKFEQVNKPNPAAAVQLPPGMGAPGPGAPPGMPPMGAGVPPPGPQGAPPGPPGADPSQPMPGMPMPGAFGQPMGQETSESVEEFLNDLTVGEYDVVVDTGPSYATKRLESAEAMTEFMQVDPSMMPLIGDVYADQMDWPGAKKIAERLRFRLPPAVLQAEASKDPKMAMAMAPLQQQLQALQQQAAQMQQQLQQGAQAYQALEMDKSAQMAKAQADMAKVQSEMQLQPLKMQTEQTKVDSAMEMADAKRAQSILDFIIKAIDLQQTQTASVMQEAAGMQGMAERIWDASATQDERAWQQGADQEERAFQQGQAVDNHAYDQQSRQQDMFEREAAMEGETPTQEASETAQAGPGAAPADTGMSQVVAALQQTVEALTMAVMTPRQIKLTEFAPDGTPMAGVSAPIGPE